MSNPAFRRLSPLTPVVRGFILVVAAGWTILRDVTRGDLGPTALMLGGVLLIGGALGVASWLRTKFWIEADELRIDTGVISRQSRRIRIDRLQGVEIVQPFVARLFGLAELRMDVAGGGAREGSLAFLPLSDAHALKDLLLARRDAARAQASAGPDASPRLPIGVVSPEVLWATPQPPQPPAVPERILARVDMGMLMLSILLSLETIVALVAVFGLLSAFAFSGQWLGASATLPILLGVGVVQFRKFSGNYRFTVSQTPAGLQVRRGLFDLNSQTIALHRLQGVVVTEPLLWRAFGWARLDVSIAGYSSSDDEGPAASTVLPVGDRRLAMYLAQHVLGGVDLAQTPMTPPPPASRWVAPVGHRFMAAGRDERLAVSREGWLVRRTHAAPHARLQSLRITQGPLQRALGVADLHLDSPPGPTHVRARHREQGEARRFFEDEVLVGRAARHAHERSGRREPTP